MRKIKLTLKILLLCSILFIGTITCGGCGAKETSPSAESEDTNDSKHLVPKEMAETLLDPKSYVIYGSATFLPISVELVDNGYDADYARTVFVEYVKTRDKTIWIQSYKCYAKNNNGSGIGESMTQAFGPDGKPEVYDGDLDELIKNFGVKVKN